MSDDDAWVALTFDDGPFPQTTPALLAALDRAGLPATMFLVGARAHGHRRLTADLHAAGHELANHSWTHSELPLLGVRLTTAELRHTQRTLEGLTGEAPALFRPPYGATDREVGGVAAGLGLTEVLWSADSRDWAGSGVAGVLAASEALVPGDVLLMHDGIPATVRALPELARALAGKGLRAGRVDPATGRAVAW